MLKSNMSKAIKCELCGIHTCRVENQKRTFMAKFPLNEDRCKQWVKLTGNEDLVYVPIEKLHQLKYICGKHFRERDFKKKKIQLRKNAIPSIDIPSTPLPDEILVGFPLHIVKNSDIVRHLTPIKEPLKSKLLNIDNAIANEHQYSLPWEYQGISESEKKESKSRLCGVPTPAPPTPASPTPASPTPATPTPATPTPAPLTPATLVPAPPDPKPLQSALPKEIDPLALDVKSEHEDSDTNTHCTEDPVYDKTIKEHVTDANPVATTLKNVTASAAVNVAPQTTALITQPAVPPKIVLRRFDLKEIKFLNRPPMKLTTTKFPLTMLQTRLKLENQKLVVQPAAKLQQSAYIQSLTNLAQEKDRLLAELALCKKENLELRKELGTLQKRNKLLEKRVANLKRIKKDKKAMFDKLTVNMSAPAKAFFEMQFQKKKKTNGRRYSLPGRIVALSIYKASPACYALLYKYFVLPSVRVLQGILTSAMKQTVVTVPAETAIEKETDANKLENLSLNDENKMDSIDDLDLIDYNINDTFQQKMDESSKAVDTHSDDIVYETQAINKEPQSSQVTEDMTDDTSEVQSVELCEGQALQLPDGRIFQLIDGQIVEVIGELKQDELNVPCDETRGTGSSDQLNPTVSDPQNTQECDQGTFTVKPLRSYDSARDTLALLSETPLPQDNNNISNTRQTVVSHYQRSHRPSHRGTSPHSMPIKSNSFDGRPANVDEMCIGNPLRSQVGEQATQIKHPHKTQQQNTKHQQTTKETSSFTDSSRTVTQRVISLKRVAIDKEPVTSPTSATHLNRIQQCYRKILKTKITSSRGPDMPDLTFS